MVGIAERTLAAVIQVTAANWSWSASIVGVAAFDATSGADVEVTVAGVFELPMVTTDVIVQGDKLYWESGQAS